MRKKYTVDFAALIFTKLSEAIAHDVVSRTCKVNPDFFNYDESEAFSPWNAAEDGEEIDPSFLDEDDEIPEKAEVSAKSLFELDGQTYVQFTYLDQYWWAVVEK